MKITAYSFFNLAFWNLCGVNDSTIIVELNAIESKRPKREIVFSQFNYFNTDISDHCSFIICDTHVFSDNWECCVLIMTHLNFTYHIKNLYLILLLNLKIVSTCMVIINFAMINFCSCNKYERMQLFWRMVQSDWLLMGEGLISSIAHGQYAIVIGLSGKQSRKNLNYFFDSCWRQW